MPGAGGVYVGGSKDSTVKQVTLKDVTVAVSGSGPREGGVLDLRPCPGQGLQKARMAGFRIEQADGVVLERCTVTWADRAAKWLGAALAMNAATHVNIVQFKGEARTWGRRRGLLKRPRGWVGREL